MDVRSVSGFFFFFFGTWISSVPVPFVEKTIFSLLYCLCSFVKGPYCAYVVLFLGFLFCSIDLSIQLPDTIYLYTPFISFKEVLKLVSASPPALDIYRQLHPRTVEYTFFSSSSGKNTKTDHILEHKTYLNEFKKMEVI